jgi:DNA-binding protein HU-beta/integration host factor subunit beta
VSVFDDSNKKEGTTKKDIVKTIAEEMNLTQTMAAEIVQKTLDAIVDALVTDERIELRNFGVFAVKRRAARTARNPKTGVQVPVPEKIVVSFKPGKAMEERVREMEERENDRLRRAIENALYDGRSRQDFSSPAD